MNFMEDETTCPLCAARFKWGDGVDAYVTPQELAPYKLIWPIPYSAYRLKKICPGCANDPDYKGSDLFFLESEAAERYQKDIKRQADRPKFVAPRFAAVIGRLEGLALMAKMRDNVYEEKVLSEVVGELRNLMTQLG